ncbi:P-loop containing nucleoside triphosphate hydrolase protein [Pilobolus umbonatus]|nr:P-loop containing nucleoside triphosphate hydrolase protein [Pilobolus umbonatus]
MQEGTASADYYDPSVTYIPLEPKPNHMNEVDPSILSKYLDPEFIDAKPDKDATDESQLEIQESEHLGIDFDVEDNGLEPTMNTTVLAPREYQFELFEKAKTDNIIVVLETGSGKTLISVLLIKEMVRREQEARLTRRKAKLAFFLVDRVPLVFQQANVIEANCDLHVEKICGEMNVDNWSEKRWKNLFLEADVCVMTAQIFLDLLRHGFLRLDEVHLLIFDECHHTTKFHPYNLIMQEFYEQCLECERPKIFGMTASPMHSKSNVTDSVRYVG